MNNTARYTGAMQEEAALEEDDEGEKLKAVGGAQAGWLAGWLVNGCPRTLRSENNLAGKQTIDAAFFFPFSFFLPLRHPQMNNCERSPAVVRRSGAAGDPLSRDAASGRALTSV